MNLSHFYTSYKHSGEPYMTTFVLSHVFKDVYIANSLGTLRKGQVYLLFTIL